MMIMTSISPTHSNSVNQVESIKSWGNYGRCFSLNSRNEIDALKSSYDGVRFLPTERTVEKLYGSTSRVNINAFFDLAKIHHEDLLLINSDIIIHKLPEFKNDGLTIFSRYDYDEDIDKSEMFIFGFDMFYVPKHLLNVFPPSIYSLGGTFWDLSLPYRFMINNIPIYYPSGKFIFHKKHKVQYDLNEWYFLGKYFRWEFKFNEYTPIEHITTIAMSQIKHKLIT